jgi:hypothetical protein
MLHGRDAEIALDNEQVWGYVGLVKEEDLLMGVIRIANSRDDRTVNVIASEATMRRMAQALWGFIPLTANGNARNESDDEALRVIRAVLDATKQE